MEGRLHVRPLSRCPRDSGGIPPSSGWHPVNAWYQTSWHRGQPENVVDRRYDGTSNVPFSKVKISWAYDALGRLVSETRDGDSLPGDGNDDYGTQEPDDYVDVFGFDLASKGAGPRTGSPTHRVNARLLTRMGRSPWSFACPRDRVRGIGPGPRTGSTPDS
jgi:hypothetical protein